MKSSEEPKKTSAERVLRTLGYRRIKDRALKPFGFNMLIYFFDSHIICSNFYSPNPDYDNKSLLTWSTETIMFDECESDEDFALQISYFEAWSSKPSTGRIVNFGFTTKEEVVSDWSKIL